MKPKIVIITNITFAKRDYKRFGISTLKNKFNVFIFDFTKNFSKKLDSPYFNIDDKNNDFNIQNINLFKLNKKNIILI